MGRGGHWLCWEGEILSIGLILVEYEVDHVVEYS